MCTALLVVLAVLANSGCEVLTVYQVNCPEGYAVISRGAEGAGSGSAASADGIGNVAVLARCEPGPQPPPVNW